MRRQLSTTSTAAAVLVLFALATAGCGEAGPHQQTFTGETMGTTYMVKLVGAGGGDKAAAIDAEVGETLERINALMSTYDPASELSRFNDSETTDWFEASPETLEVLQEAQRISEASGGAFDVTVGPLVDAWGFGPPKPGETPDAAALDALRARIGYEKLELDVEGRRIRKKQPELRLDLSAIAKGYGVDAVAEVLDAHGVEHYMVEVGGEVRVKGKNASGDPWRIAIEEPVEGVREIHTVLPLTDIALATSGNYRNFYDRGGERYTHTIDPATGAPALHKLASASVLAPRCATADAYATAMMVLGPEKAMALAEAQGLAVLLLVHDDQGGFEEQRSTRFDETFPEVP